MNTSNSTRPKSSSLLLFLAPIGVLLLATPLALAQTTAPPSEPNAADLAKYDRNKDGQLDATERAVRQADEDRRARNSVVSAQPGEQDEEEIVEMSPFEVKGEKEGYYASDTMSGTRLGSKIDDLASSITVVTLEQMEDFGMLDINDIFAYEAGTEGMGTYTDITVETSGNFNDNSMASPTSANRIRGVGSANISLGNFETSRRVPVDKVGIEGVEITRGPNSSIFGLGNPAGTVNLVASTGNLRKNKTQVQLRADSFGGYREHVDVNRVIIRDKLALRFSQVFMHAGYRLKPSGTDTQRYNFMVKYQPFKNTTLTGSYQYYQMSGNRPNSIMPRDGISEWVEEGSPVWDPVLHTAYDSEGNVIYANSGGNIPSYFNSLYQQTGRGSALLSVDGGAVSYWTAPRGTTTGSPLGLPAVLSPYENPAIWDLTVKSDQPMYNYVIPAFGRLGASQRLFRGANTASDKSMYDWSKINLASINSEYSQTGQYMAQLTHLAFETPRQLMALQLGWFREDSRLDQNFAYGKPYGYLLVDPNIRRMDGTPNPNFLRPFISIPDASRNVSPLLNDTYRAQLAYKLDLRREKNPLRWLGLHQVAAYQEYKNFVTRRYSFKPAMVSDHTWLPAGVNRATSSARSTNYGPELYNKNSPTGSRNYFMYYVGDDQGNNIDYAPTAFSHGVYDYTFGNPATGEFVTEPAEIGYAGSLDNTGSLRNTLKIQKTLGAVLQSHLLKGRVVTTFGVRRDKVFDKAGVLPRMMPDGITHDYSWDEQWEDDWKSNVGDTTTQGVVLKPFQWLSFFANKSDSFLPDDPAVNLKGERVPNPTGLGKDYGFMLRFFDGKLNLRVNHYDNQTIGNRRGTSTTIANRAMAIDIYDQTQSRDFALQYRAGIWLNQQASAQGITLTQEQLNLKIAETMQMDPALVAQLSNLRDEGGRLSEPENTLAKGNEISLNYNPSRFWTMKFNFTQMESIQAKVGEGLLQYLAEREPVWNSIIDPYSPVPPLPGQPPPVPPIYGYSWFDTQYRGPNYSSARMYLEGNSVRVPLDIAIAQEGLSLPQIRKYRANFVTNYQLAGITDNRFLKPLSIGGALRWIDKGSIGYWGEGVEPGVPVTSTSPVVVALDKNRPIWDKARFSLDLNFSYRTKLFFTKKAGARFQLNIRNVLEDGRLQPISARPDGSIYAYRIVNPRQFILTCTFEM